MARKVDQLSQIKRKKEQLANLEVQLMEMQEKKEKLTQELIQLEHQYTEKLLQANHLQIEDLAELLATSDTPAVNEDSIQNLSDTNRQEEI
ncbi:hypothetical protein V4S35_14215 [Enterococcus cecorum]